MTSVNVQVVLFSALMLSGSRKSGHLVKRCLVGELNREELELALLKMQQALTLEVSLFRMSFPVSFILPSHGVFLSDNCR